MRLIELTEFLTPMLMRTRSEAILGLLDKMKQDITDCMSNTPDARLTASCGRLMDKRSYSSIR